jgi:pimeloyl-ACP methyl ester carboxylesterase
MSEAIAADGLTVAGIDLEVLQGGSGRPLVLLHGMDNFDRGARFLGLLADRARVIAPSHPGFGHSRRPDGFETVYDLVHFCLEFLDSLPFDKVSLAGFSFGGWLAAEVAAASTHRIDRLILVDALGIKISGRETPDILDVFNAHPDEVTAASWHDPARFAPDYDAMSDEALVVRARNRESLCLYAWHPYMYNPQLKRWLARIRVPSLVLWGAADGIVTPEYGRAYAALIPGARFTLIEAAGHHPEIEQPEAFAERVTEFLEA